ncbi:Glycosyltransferase involved in cell wall bisynthesis [Clostridium grantii DSM 8605]|uniref:Glycosyltransferase involved in cell wall bisynthesis n=2 Tax=Clostridium TaxID=1485 RepID=A0A1M5W0B7_9CLOT|nr:Glycosyltransferase involved in cell wall bisynthesis [Clostridium grantii DSM 8605]
MIVCLFTEGSYPYITGGVSSWVHQLITSMPNIKFKIFCIMPSKEEKIKYRYDIPRNVIEVKTIFLDDYTYIKHRMFKKNCKLSSQEKDDIYDLLQMNENINWSRLLRIFTKGRKVGSAIDFLQSFEFWKLALKNYNKDFDSESFNNYFWTMRSMLVPFIYLLQQEPIKADIYHSVSTGYAGIVATSFASRTGKPFLLSEHGIYCREREEEILKAKWVTGIYKKFWIDFFYAISIAAYKEAEIITSLYYRSRDMQIKLGASSEKTRIVSNGVDISKFQKSKKEHEGYNVGAILRVVPIKDVMTLIKAFKIVCNNIKEAKLYIIGPTDEDPEYYQQCNRLVKSLQLTENIIFTGRVDVSEYLKIIDVIVLTSISEGQPLVILEAMAARTPVVATNVGSCSEMLEKNQFEEACGIITKLASPNETATAIIKLLKDPQLREGMGLNGIKRAKRAYNKKIIIDSFKNFYDILYVDYSWSRSKSRTDKRVNRTSKKTYQRKALGKTGIYTK